MKLQDRTAIITGGGRGIGEAIALAFGREGAQLMLAARTVSELERTAEKVRQSGGKVQFIQADVSNQRDVTRMVDETVKAYGVVEILVNAAGVYGPIGQLVEVDLDEWVSALQVNLIGTLYSCRAVLPYMIGQRRGKMINFSGGGASSPLPRFTAYGVSKTAVVRLTETLAEEVKPYGIDVNAIAPGMVDTRLQDAVLAAGDRAGELFSRIKRLRETGESGTPPGLAAELAVFLASADSDGLTGKLISAPHDPWREWKGKGTELSASPMFTLRRMDPFTLRPLLGKLE